MPTSTQANFNTINDADAHAQGLDGGLNLKSDPTRLAPPATTRADNGWYCNPGNVGQLPAFSSVMQANTSHVYGLHARDLQQPSTSGDVMVWGEVLDAPGSTTNRWTTPCWSDGYGQTLNTAQPSMPVAQRTRVMTGRLNYSGSVPGPVNAMLARQEAGYSSTSPRRYALAYHNGTSLNATFGLLDGQIETADTITTYYSNADYCEIAGLQGTANWICATASGANLKVFTFDFHGNAIGPTAVSTTAMPWLSATNVHYAPMTIMQHAGRTYVAYVNNTSSSSYVVTLYDVLANTSLALPITASSVPTGGFACVSPYEYTAPSGAFYFGCLFNGQVYVLCQTAVGAAATVVATSSALSTAATTGYYNGSASGAGGSAQQTLIGQVDWTATMACTIFDTQGGAGVGASLGFTVFRHYPEQITRSSDSSTFWYQAVSADRISFQTNATSASGAGTITSIGQNVFRTPSGVQLCSKAFTLFPSAAGGAGLPGAKQAYCLVRCGAAEPNILMAPSQGNSGTNLWPYGQPTYFVIDHQARVVSRALESSGPSVCDYTLANNTIYTQGTTSGWGNSIGVLSLSGPLVQASANDVSCLDLTLPAWVQTNAATPTSFAAVYLPTNSPAGTYYTAPPTNVIMQPCAIVLSVANQGALCSAVQAGPYTVVSGALTCVHDGRGMVEANYHFATHCLQVIVKSSTTGPGAGPAGQYYWCVVWEWYDSLGRVHRSTPSVPWPGIVASGSFLTGATVNCPQPVTAKTAVGGIMYARLYRSLLNNSTGVFYLVSTTAISALAAGNYWAALSDAGTYIDPTSTAYATAAQNQLTAEPRLYTNPVNSVSTYPSMPPPAMISMVGAKGRCFGIQQYLGQHRLVYTSVQAQQFPFEWNVYNYAPVPPDLGDVRGLAFIDDKVIVFGTRQLATINGDGPLPANTTGAPAPSDGFSGVVPIPTPAGVIGAGASALTPDGIVFQGYSGIQMLRRDLSITPIGAGVDVITGRQINNPGTVYGRAVTLTPLQSIVFTTGQAAPVVYNYLTQKWSTWPLLINATSLVQRLDGSIYVALQPISLGTWALAATPTVAGADVGVLGAVYAPVYLGNNAAAALVLESPWILPSGESGGEAQIWDTTITGTYLGPHVLRVEQAFNYVNSYTSVVQFSVTQNPNIYQYRVRPRATGRIWALRVRITLLPISTLSSSYPMAALGDLVLNYGIKQGTTRLGAATSG